MDVLSEAEIRLLQAVAELGPGPVPLVPELLEATRLTRPTLHRVAHNAEHANLVLCHSEAGPERRMGRQGRPRVLLTLTPAGRDALMAYRNELLERWKTLNEILEAGEPGQG